MQKIKIQFWGVRGSYPMTGKSTFGFGGNTTCLEILYGKTRIIIDAGTGIFKLGEKINLEKTACKATILLTHYHLDHVMGLPFFLPLYDARSRITLAGPKLWEGGVKQALQQFMAPPYFPYPLAKAAASIKYQDLKPICAKIDAVKITPIRLNHPGGAFGYRFDFPGKRSMCFASDSELDPPIMQMNVAKWAEGVDLFIHDAHFTEQEYSSKRGWGHSSIPQVLSVAERADAKRVCLFHHDPHHSDVMLKKLAAQLPKNCEFATEGKVIVWGQSPVIHK